MAFADPQTVTIDGTASTLPRVYEKENVGSFTGPNKDVEMVIRPTLTKAMRRHQVVQLKVAKNATDPISGFVKRVESTMSLVLDAPVAGFSDAELTSALSGLITWATTGTNANLKKFVAGEN